ncbi:MAG: MBL fold metallo-hydrolase [Candidatus Omnitrophica bacterium]|nr:MBL fold metallo-hydrolase [Candidatus Omnitrophota bacterium]
MTIPQEFILEQIEIGPMANYAYFIGDAATKEVAIVDPGWDADTLIHEAQKAKYKIIAILLTHGHYDHVDAVEPLLKKFDVPVYVSKYEPLSLHSKKIVKVENGEKIKIGHIEIDCLLTPGHTPGSQCFRYKNVLLTGDTLFLDSCGRCDLPGGSAKSMAHSLNKVIKALPDDTSIFPGHAYGDGRYALLKDQKKTNPYLQ